MFHQDQFTRHRENYSADESSCIKFSEALEELSKVY